MTKYSEHLTVNYGKDKVKLLVEFHDGAYSGYYLKSYLETSEERNNFFMKKLLEADKDTVDNLNKAVKNLQDIKQFIINILLAPYERV